jgi:hypothetical protein
VAGRPRRWHHRGRLRLSWRARPSQSRVRRRPRPAHRCRFGGVHSPPRSIRPARTHVHPWRPTVTCCSRTTRQPDCTPRPWCPNRPLTCRSPLGDRSHRHRKPQRATTTFETVRGERGYFIMGLRGAAMPHESGVRSASPLGSRPKHAEGIPARAPSGWCCRSAMPGRRRVLKRLRMSVEITLDALNATGPATAPSQMLLPADAAGQDLVAEGVVDCDHVRVRGGVPGVEGTQLRLRLGERQRSIPIFRSRPRRCPRCAGSTLVSYWQPYQGCSPCTAVIV